MEDNKIAQVNMLLYDCTKKEILKKISKIQDNEILYVYAYNYNWDDGFEIPQKILSNKECELSTALLLFYSADGYSYLLDKFSQENLSEWFSFVTKLYTSILNKNYPPKKIGYKIPLSKVQIYKLKKTLTEQENIFIMDVIGKNLDITL